jgi:ectoine hydroxylase-related dioxygenase (phytanoyl-CoA dioxygenase family)
MTVLDNDALYTTLERDGYCVVPGVLSPAECDAVRAALDRCAEEDAANDRVWTYDGGANQRHFTLLNRGEEFVSLATNPIVLDLMGRILGSRFLLSLLNANVTGPGGDRGIFHADQSYAPEPFTRPLVANAIWMIDDFTEENGATRCVPGSHELQRAPHGDEPGYERVAMCGSAGDVAIFEGRLWHHTGANTSQTKRRGILAYYVSYWIRTAENWTVSLRPDVRAAHPELLDLVGITPYHMFGTVDGPAIELKPDTERTGHTKASPYTTTDR